MASVAAISCAGHSRPKHHPGAEAAERIEQGIWELIGQDRTLAAISDVIVEEYDVNREIIEKDLLKLAEDLAAQKLVQVRE